MRRPAGRRRRCDQFRVSSNEAARSHAAIRARTRQEPRQTRTGSANCRRRRCERLRCNISRRLRELLCLSRFWDASLSDKPITFSLLTCRFIVRLSAPAILATGPLRVMGLKTRTSPFDWGLPDWAVFCRSDCLSQVHSGLILRQWSASMRRLQGMASLETNSSAASAEAPSDQSRSGRRLLARRRRTSHRRFDEGYCKRLGSKF